METTKRLVMVFMTNGDKTVSLSVDNPVDNIQESAIKSAMETIVAQNISAPNGEDLVAIKEAKVVITNKTEYELA